jgi:hypothetical protein
MTRIHRTSLAGVVALLVAAVFLVSRQSKSPVADRRETAAVGKNESQPAREIPRPARREAGSRWGSLPELPPAVLSPYPPGSVENQNWITGRIAALDDAAWLDDPESMRRILAEMHNPQPEIRAAARAAITAFGSGDAVPYLEMTATTTHDETERQELVKVVEFLKLPTITEYLEGQEQGVGPSPSSGDTHSR